MDTQQLERPVADAGGTAGAAKADARSARPEAERQSQPSGGIRFDWVMSGFSAWLLAGLFLDGWAHNHGAVDESFFTPWHGVLYSGFLATTLFTVATLIRNHARGYPWPRALPAGYGLTLLGALIFAAGGVGDMMWHELFGVEQDIEALVSPTHLTLALGGGLILTGPFRAAWRREQSSHGQFALLPMLLSLAFTLSLLTFFTMYSHPLMHPYAAARYGRSSDEMGITSLLLESALLMGMVLLVVRRWRLPFGGLTLIFTLNATAMGFLNLHHGYRLALVAAAGAAGLIADLLLYSLKPTVHRPAALRIFACAVPAVFYLLHFLALGLTEGMGWSVHLATGSIVLAGMVGWLLSYLPVPPRPAAVTDPFASL